MEISETPMDVESLYSEKIAVAMANLLKAEYCSTVGLAIPGMKISENDMAKAYDDACDKGKRCKDAGFKLISSSHRAVEKSDLGVKDALYASVFKIQKLGSNDRRDVIPPTGPTCLVLFRGSHTLLGKKEKADTHHEDYKKQTMKSGANHFRGSMDSLVPVKGCEGCANHLGYSEIWKGVASGVVKGLQANGCKPGRGNVMLAGYSLGAAVMTIGMYHLKSQGYHIVTSYNVGSPRVFNQPACSAFDRMWGEEIALFRVTNAKDTVPNWPRGGWCHVGSNVHYESKKKREFCLMADQPDCGFMTVKIPKKQTASDADDPHCLLPLCDNNLICPNTKFYQKCPASAAAPAGGAAYPSPYTGGVGAGPYPGSSYPPR